MGEILQDHPWLFLIIAPAMWLGATYTLGYLMGWYDLVRAYPNKPERAIWNEGLVSGSMGMVSISGCMSLSACPSGLRVSIWWIFGPFSKPFMVPWSELEVRRSGVPLMRRCALGFGHPPVTTLEVWARVADNLQRAAGDRWPKETALDVLDEQVLRQAAAGLNTLGE